MTTELVQYGQFSVQEWAQQRPLDNPVDEYINDLRQETSKTTMLQALGAMATIYDGDGRPDIDRSLPPAARKVAADSLKEYARNYDWLAIDDRATLAMIAELKALGYARSSQEKMIAAVRGVLGRCMSIHRRHDRETRQQLVAQWKGTLEQLSSIMQMMDSIVGMRYSATQSAIDELAKYAKKIKEVAPENSNPQRETGRALKPQEVKKLFAACAKQGGAIGARNQAILALGFGCGLRRSEIAALRCERVDWEGLSIGDEPYMPIRIVGAKGDKTRTVNASNGTRQSLLQWRAIRGDAPGPLLYSFDRWTGMQTGLPIGGQDVYNTLLDLAQLAGVEPLSPHDMRRSFVSSFIRTTGDISMASKLAGHASIETTKIYDRRGAEEEAQAVIEAVHVPFEWIDVQQRLEQAPA
jgi:integrase